VVAENEIVCFLQGLETCVWRPLPPGWTEHRDASSRRTFYMHAESGRKMWMPPNEEEEAAESRDAPIRRTNSAALVVELGKLEPQAKRRRSSELENDGLKTDVKSAKVESAACPEETKIVCE
jgi:hypothetical protein